MPWCFRIKGRLSPAGPKDPAGSESGPLRVAFGRGRILGNRPWPESVRYLADLSALRIFRADNRSLPIDRYVHGAIPIPESNARRRNSLNTRTLTDSLAAVSVRDRGSYA